MTAHAEDLRQHTTRLAVAQGEPPQYTGWQILGVWAAAALPGGILAWGVTPLVGPIAGSITSGSRGLQRVQVLIMLLLGLVRFRLGLASPADGSGSPARSPQASRACSAR